MSGRTLIIVVTAVVAAAIAAGLVVHGSPALARERRFDERRMEDLDEIVLAIDSRFAATSALPQTLGDLDRALSDAARLRDPVTQNPYEYLVRSTDQYELCAVFSQASTNRYRPHGAGRWCSPHRARPRPR